MLRSRLVVASLVAVAGLGCGGGDDPDIQVGDAGPSGPRYRGTGTVLESPEHGPELCRTVEESYPPQCSGLPLVGWSWDAVDDEESASGTTWGTYEVTGTWDGERLTLTQPPGSADPEPPDEIDFSSPCPEPPGGWAVVDPATATQAALAAAIEAARGRPDFAGVWLDQPLRGSEPTNDPTNLVLNVKVAGDTAAVERDLRAIWGGALCVSGAERTHAELRAIQAEIGATAAELGMTSSGINEVANAVRVEVTVEDEELQATYDERYGPGAVVVTAWLERLT